MATLSISVIKNGLATGLRGAVRTACVLGLTAAVLQASPLLSGQAWAGTNDLFPVNRTSGGFVTDGGVYDVVQGDTLYGISKRFGVSIADIKAANGLTSDIIGPGKLLKIPGLGGNQVIGGLAPSPQAPASLGNGSAGGSLIAGNSYVVQSGDTLYQISVANKVSVRDLAAINQLKSGDRIYVGQSLMLPAKPGGLGQLTAQKQLEAQPGSGFGLPRASAGAPKQVAGLGRNLSVPKPVRKPSAIQVSTQVAAVATRPAAPSPSQTAAVTAAVTAPGTTSAKAATQVAKKDSSAPAKAKGASLTWPVRGQLLQTYGLKSGGVKIDGITIAVADGEPIKSAGDGMVMYAGSALADFGQLLLIKHDNGLITAYAHNKSISVSKGQRVTAGQVVALAGQSGSADRPQLHFQVRENGKPVNPLPFLTR